jgi:hypothetical protein
MQTRPTCKTTPPPGQNINEYLLRLRDILGQLAAINDKEKAIERLELMINSIKEIVLKETMLPA